jgi:transposase
VRQLRAQLRHRAGLVRLGTQLQNRIHAVAADHGYDRTGSYWTGPGRGWLAELDLPPVSREIVTDCLASIDALAPVIERLDGELHQHAKAGPRVKVLRTLPGVGEFTALVMLAEIGDISRFGSARKLASWAGLTPTVRGSDLTVRHGHISKQGSAWLRWVLNQAAQTAKTLPGVRRHLRRHQQAAREEDRHHRDLPQAAHPRLPPARRRPGHPGARHRQHCHHPASREGHQAPGTLANAA